MSIELILEHLSPEQLRDHAQSREQEISELIADICKERNIEVDDFLKEYAELEGEETLRGLGLELVVSSTPAAEEGESPV